MRKPKTDSSPDDTGARAPEVQVTDSEQAPAGNAATESDLAIAAADRTQEEQHDDPIGILFYGGPDSTLPLVGFDGVGRLERDGAGIPVRRSVAEKLMKTKRGLRFEMTTK